MLTVDQLIAKLQEIRGTTDRRGITCGDFIVKMSFEVRGRYLSAESVSDVTVDDRGLGYVILSP